PATMKHWRDVQMCWVLRARLRPMLGMEDLLALPRWLAFGAVDQPESVRPLVEVVDEQRAVDVVEDGLRVDRERGAARPDHAAHAGESLSEGHLVVQISLPVAVLDEGRRALD